MDAVQRLSVGQERERLTNGPAAFRRTDQIEQRLEVLRMCTSPCLRLCFGTFRVTPLVVMGHQGAIDLRHRSARGPALITPHGQNRPGAGQCECGVGVAVRIPPRAYPARLPGPQGRDWPCGAARGHSGPVVDSRPVAVAAVRYPSHMARAVSHSPRSSQGKQA